MKNAIDAPADGYTFVGWKEIDRTDGSDSVVISATISAEFGAKELSPKDYSFVAEFKRSVTLIVSPSFGSFTDGSPTANKEIFLYEGELPVPKSKEDKYVFKGCGKFRSDGIVKDRISETVARFERSFVGVKINVIFGRFFPLGVKRGGFRYRHAGVNAAGEFFVRTPAYESKSSARNASAKAERFIAAMQKNSR